MTAAYNQERWSLDALFPGHETPEFKSAMKGLEESITAFEKLRPELDVEIDEEDFLKIVTELEEITKLSNRLYGFAGLWFASDTQDQDAQSLQARIEQFLVGLQNKTLFFSLWWKELDQTDCGPADGSIRRSEILAGGNAPLHPTYPD